MSEIGDELKALFRTGERGAYLRRLGELIPRTDIAVFPSGAYTAAYVVTDRDGRDDGDEAMEPELVAALLVQLPVLVDALSAVADKMRFIEEAAEMVRRRPLSCGWCLKVLGPDLGGTPYEGEDALVAHVSACEHNPLVARIRALRALVVRVLEQPGDGETIKLPNGCSLLRDLVRAVGEP